MNFRSIRILSIGISIFVFTFLLIVFLIRDKVLKIAIDKISTEIHSRTGLQVNISNARITGWDNFIFTDILIGTPGREKNLSIESMSFNVRILPALKGDLRINAIDISGLQLNLFQNDSVNNMEFLNSVNDTLNNFHREKIEKDYAGKLSSYIELLMDMSPGRVKVENAAIRVFINKLKIEAFVSKLILNDDLLKSEIEFLENGESIKWSLVGNLNRSNTTFDARINSGGFKDLKFPLSSILPELNFKGKDFFISLKHYSPYNGQLKISGAIKGKEILINHPRLAPGDVRIPNVSINYNMEIGRDYLLLDSSSSLLINKIPLHLFCLYNTTSGNEIDLRMNIPSTPSGDFFQSLPQGLFNIMHKIEASGSLNFKMHFKINTLQKDSLEFSSDLEADNFNIKNSPNADLSKMNGDFLYNIYENGRILKTILVGRTNPGYYTLGEISNFLKSAVITSEDGSFFYHRGFNEESFKNSIIENIKEKRFVRGGSTISMQLVKNVYLNRNKNISRKIEEAMIVWIIENKRLVPKEKMYEIYLNIIEWGPGIYGIGEASEFYFHKKPASLTLGESLFLAMIIPMPRKFHYFFDQNGRLKESTLSFYKLVGRHLEKKGIIAPFELEYLSNNISITGNARKLLKNYKMDSLIHEEGFENFEF